MLDRDMWRRVAYAARRNASPSNMRKIYEERLLVFAIIEEELDRIVGYSIGDDQCHEDMLDLKKDNPSKRYYALELITIKELRSKT